MKTLKDILKRLVYVLTHKKRKKRKPLTKEERARLHGKALKQEAGTQSVARRRCKHLKGGVILASISDYAQRAALSQFGGYENGFGDSGQYAVTKHIFANGDLHIRCMRCGKNWKPGDDGYQEAMDFPTYNSTSTSIQFGCAAIGAMPVGGQRGQVTFNAENEKEFQARYRAALGS